LMAWLPIWGTQAAVEISSSSNSSSGGGRSTVEARPLLRFQTTTLELREPASRTA
jgi:hypothetical protein